MIRDEDGAFDGLCLSQSEHAQLGGFVNDAEKLINQKLALPADIPGAGLENMIRNARQQRLKIILPSSSS